MEFAFASRVYQTKVLMQGRRTHFEKYSDAQFLSHELVEAGALGDRLENSARLTRSRGGLGPRLP